MGSTTVVRTEPLVSDCDPLVRPRREEVRAQLARILASPLFQHSKHYPGLLRYVVNEVLEGRGGQLKERALGVEVFGRDPDYDTNADPVVRTSACEVRKRIAQYYHEPGRETEIRIDLASGSYAPEFRYSPSGPIPLIVEQRPETPEPLSRLTLVRDAAHRRRVSVVVAVVAVAILGIGASAWQATPSAVESFWDPVWGSSESVIMAIGGTLVAAPPSANAASPIVGPSFREVMRGDQLAFADALTMARITGMTREYGKKKLDIRRAIAFSLTDLRKSPAILVGAFNNSWTMRLENDLRFTFDWDSATHTGKIRDRKDPANLSWTHDPGLPYSGVVCDYAVVSRFLNPLTEKMLVVVAGMGRDGTLAAGEFVTEPRYLEMLASRAPKNWAHKNLQVLLATDIVNGTTGPPRILATYFW
jgi:hypothetical protein